MCPLGCEAEQKVTSKHRSVCLRGEFANMYKAVPMRDATLFERLLSFLNIYFTVIIKQILLTEKVTHILFATVQFSVLCPLTSPSALEPSCSPKSLRSSPNGG